MIDIQHDSPEPIHEQITNQIQANVASGALKPGVKLAEYRALAQELLINPQAVARAFSDLERDGVLKKISPGGMEVTAGAAAVCRVRLQETARGRIRQAVARGLAAGMVEAEILNAVEQEMAAARAQPLTADELQRAIKKPTHERSHRDSQGIQDLSRQAGPGSA